MELGDDTDLGNYIVGVVSWWKVGLEPFERGAQGSVAARNRSQCLRLSWTKLYRCSWSFGVSQDATCFSVNSIGVCHLHNSCGYKLVAAPPSSAWMYDFFIGVCDFIRPTLPLFHLHGCTASPFVSMILLGWFWWWRSPHDPLLVVAASSSIRSDIRGHHQGLLTGYLLRPLRDN